MSEQNRAFAHGDSGRGLYPVLSGPRIDIAEKDSMCFQNILVGQPANGVEMLERLGDASDEGTVFQMLDDVRVLLPERIPQVSAGFEIPEGVEAHSRASRR